MTNCQGGDLIAVTEKEWVSTDNKHTGSQLYHRRKDRVEVALGAGMYDMELQPELAGRRLQVSRLALGTGKGRVEERGRDGRCRHQLVQYLHLLLHQRHAQVGHARDVAAWSVEASNKSNRDRVDRYGRRRSERSWSRPLPRVPTKTQPRQSGPPDVEPASAARARSRSLRP